MSLHGHSVCHEITSHGCQLGGQQRLRLGCSLVIEGRTKLPAQGCCQGRGHGIANLAVLVMHIAVEAEVIWEALHTCMT